MKIEEEIQHIEAFIRDYFEAYFGERNLNRTLNFLAPEITGFGTGLEENGFLHGQMHAEYKRDIDEISDCLEYNDLKIFVGHVEKEFAIVNCTFNIQTELVDGVLFLPNLRNSFTLKRVGTGWKIISIHVSAPYDQQEGKEMFPVKRMIEKNDILTKLIDGRTKELLEVNEELSRANSTKDKLLSLIGHDLRSPFTGLLGLLKLLQEDFDQLRKEDKKEYIAVIYEAGNKIFDLLDNLLIWTNIQRNNFDFNPGKVNLSEIINDSITFFDNVIARKGIDMKSTCDPSLYAYCDSQMVQTIIRNLVSNALKFTPENGSVKISVNISKRQADLLRLCVQDNGIGLSQDSYETLFDFGRMKSTKGTDNEEGYGIGLALCKEFIDIHGTEIWADPEIKQGCRICFTLKKTS